MLNYSFRSFGFPHKQARAKLSFERVSEQQSQARGFPVLDLEAMDRDSSLPQYSIGKRGRRTQIAANVECIMKGLEILSPRTWPAIDQGQGPPVRTLSLSASDLKRKMKDEASKKGRRGSLLTGVCFRVYILTLDFRHVRKKTVVRFHSVLIPSINESLPAAQK